ncbi:MAG: hypothetical protein MK008_08665 [Bdellovibrionales bacterium]|nr:hypothetical protein [Bdellovibrionales bacterium]
MSVDRQTLLNIQLAGVKANKPIEMTLFMEWLELKLKNPHDADIDRAFDSNWIKIWNTANLNWPFPIEVTHTEIEKRVKKAKLIIKTDDDTNLEIQNLNIILKPKIYNFKNFKSQNITSFINSENGYEAIDQASFNCGVNLQDQETNKMYSVDFKNLVFKVVGYE